MIRKIFFLTIFIFSGNYLFAQNLISNGDFEEYTDLPNGGGEWYKCKNWSNVNNHIDDVYPYASPDYFHTAGWNGAELPHNGYATVYPYSGNAVMGFVGFDQSNASDFREYISTKLSTSMVMGQAYKVSFWITNGADPYYKNSCDHIGIVMSSLPLQQVGHERIVKNAQMEIPGLVWANEWKSVSFTFIADENYNYLSVGNFADSVQINTKTYGIAYYFVDKIEVKPITSLVIAGSTSICLGEIVRLNAINANSYTWVDSLNPSVVLSTSSTLSVSPIKKSTYYLFSSKDTASFTVDVKPIPVLHLGNDTTLCEGAVLNIHESILNGIYKWQDHSLEPDYQIAKAGQYWLKITVDNCSVSDTIHVDYLNQVNLGKDVVMCEGKSLQLNATQPGAIYIWQDKSSDPVYNVSQSGTYWVNVSLRGCSTSDTITITAYDCEVILEMPDVFTPGNDGINDSFIPMKIKGITNATLVIYNRWGLQVFQTDDLVKGWDGKDTADGIYYWSIRYTDINQESKEIKGDLTLIR